jgi:hypothetical protein
MNCSAAQASQTFTGSTSFQRTGSISLSKAMTNAESYGVNVSAKTSVVFTIGARITHTLAGARAYFYPLKFVKSDKLGLF